LGANLPQEVLRFETISVIFLSSIVELVLFFAYHCPMQGGRNLRERKRIHIEAIENNFERLSCSQLDLFLLSIVIINEDLV